MRIRPIFEWRDLWIGAYWDRKKRRLYILPLPCIGVVLEFKLRLPELKWRNDVERFDRL